MKPKVLLALLLVITLTGCGTLAKATPSPLPAVVLGSNNPAPQQSPAQSKGGAATASGVVVSAQEAQLAFALGGSIKTVSVAAGDPVQAGQALVTLDDAALQAQQAQAQAALDAAQASYDLLASGPTAEQLRQAEAVLALAKAGYARTAASARPEEVAAAQAALDAANDAYQKIKAGPQEEDIALAKANLLSAEAALKQAQARYDSARQTNPAGVGGSPVALALEEATNGYNAAKALYDKAAKAPDKAQLSAAYEQVASARAALARVLNPARDFDLAQAQAQVDQAQAQLDALKAGPRAQQLDAAKAQVASAQAQLRAARLQAEQMTLKAPFAGTVGKVSVHRGEWVAPGQSALTVLDLTRLRVETTDLSERDVPHIAIGQAVTVQIKALGQDVAGRVSAISPLADTLGGDVVYKATIELDAQPAGLRAGMSTQVQFGARQ